MKECRGDLFNHPADAIVITTNPIINSAGLTVMGRGVAFQAAQKYPWLRKALAQRLTRHGNHVYVFGTWDYGVDQTLVTLPVKHHWKDKADWMLINHSILELVRLTDALGWESVALCRPGCGNGGLDWPRVKALIERHLDDRFVVIERES